MAKLLDSDSIAFQTEGRLLQELGLRLVSSPEVALVELIKNAYDADSPLCAVTLQDDESTIVIEDKGHGMTLDDFKTKWMRIATASKVSQELSPGFRRRLTGAKGIGRFAVRYLGDHLTLTSVAWDPRHGCQTQLTAEFDWPALDKARDISQLRVPYTLEQAPSDAEHGTKLTIRNLRSSGSFTRSKGLRNNVLRIVSPIQGLDSGRFASAAADDGKDPGFRIVLPGDVGSVDDVNLASYVLDNYWGRVTISLTGSNLKFSAWLPGIQKPKTLSLRVTTHISKGFFADIRYFPRRAGVFRGKNIDGKLAWAWVRDNCGVKIIDHGFHVSPYGFEDNDWLCIDIDRAHSMREWRTDIAKKHFPLTQAEKADPAANPVLNLPYSWQLIGGVFVETRRNLGGEDETDLVPAMDRAGLLENKAFEELYHFVRAGLEFLAHEDKAELDRKAELEAKEVARTAREEIRGAIKYIEQSPSLTAGDKSRIVKQYRYLYERIEEQEAYSEQARRSLSTMGLLGVVAGFMTHESKAVVHELEQALEQVRGLVRKEPSLAKNAEVLSQRLGAFRNYLEYVRLFVQNVRSPVRERLSAAGQVRHVLNRFKAFADARGIEVVNEVASDIKTPEVPVTAYSGILLNLYTNALKAVIAATTGDQKPRIAFRAWNEGKKHVVEILDNGVGIPPELRKRIWEPLYTTTSDVGNPLGSGMGLGLTLVKQVVADLGGSVSLVADVPPGYNTCFRVSLPMG